MIDRTTNLRWRRRFRRRRQQVEDMGAQAELGIEQHFFKRLSNLVRVRRFVFSWILLLCLLILGTITQIRGLNQYYQVLEPAPGGTYNEGILGMFTNANPLYATGAADSAVARLVFSGLLRYDHNNKLVGDLAERVDSDKTGHVYTVKLRSGLQWHDGQPLTAADVVYTYKTIQNPDARSSLFNAWKDIAIASPDPSTIVFTLPNALSTFPDSLTNGIVPKHVLGTTQPGQLRTARFNSVSPIGSGPFKWEKLEVTGTTQETREESIGLVPNRAFHRSVPKLQRFVIRTFRDEQRMLNAYKGGELTSMAGLSSVSDDIRQVPDFYEYDIPLTGQVMVFFKTTQPPLDDYKVRRALVQSVKLSEVLGALNTPVIATKGPLLAMHIGYDPQLTQLNYSIKQATKYLNEQGWRMGPNGIRVKKGRPLAINLYAQNTSDYVAVTGQLQKIWRALGVQVEVLLKSDADIQAVVRNHDYNALLYGISLGTDPDVFAYWHGSQADARSPTRLNLSEYNSVEANLSLEAGRTRSNPALRAAKYKPFLEAWRQEAPALSLYQPNFLYVTRGQVFNFEAQVLNGAIERYANVENWMIREARVTR